MAEPLTSQPILQVDELHVYYGHAHVLQSVSFSLERGVLAVVGRNGMGKTTLCNAIMGLVPAASGSVRIGGREILGQPPHRIVAHGVGYVPQGRRVWPSLIVDEHLRIAARSRHRGSWTIERVYELFPRLAERRRHGGAQLSGGEQQMLAIGRALLTHPRLLIMDEPTEGLAPLIVEQVALTLKQLADEDQISVLLIEQNLGVATDVADWIAVLVNGRVARQLPASELAADHQLQQRLLGVSAQEVELEPAESAPEEPPRIFQVIRRFDEVGTPIAAPSPAPAYSIAAAPTRWSRGHRQRHRLGGPQLSPRALDPAPPALEPEPIIETVTLPVAATAGRAAYVAGTFDTKGRELTFIANCLKKLGLQVVTVDLSTSQRPSPADVGSAEVAHYHPDGPQAVFSGDRGSAVSAMAQAFERLIVTRRDLVGIISAGGSGGTALATPAMRALPIGLPKIMVSTVASGNVKDYVGPVDICMMYSVTDVSGIHRISERILANAAHALAGMIIHATSEQSRADHKQALGLTMFGVTTPCVQTVTQALEDRFDCLVFHATGTGGQSLEKLVDSGLLAGVIDVTTTEIADLFVGGVFSAGPQRLDAIIRSRIPYVGSCGALDMVNWGSIDSVPDKFKRRNLYQHNPQVTLMRTTPEENAEMGRWIADKLNRCEGPVRFLLPAGGVSLIDAPGQPFHDPAANRALFNAIGQVFKPTRNRRLLTLPHNINDPLFAAALVEQFLEIFPDEPIFKSSTARYLP